ncbi:TolC family protein [Christiangramia forsetii]|uniref:HlyD family secretion protein n=2 Tax=Christiangramia forsetii TaxID=411153 RepID=A0LXU3_CHRFK|nr:TolC family protein [Christiangramia forsetii]GGG35869.1 transporter [Christiangramia forsetii]CAL65188.1 HlyD family secretion protein [Christiangramia forsetii KT0803]
MKNFSLIAILLLFCSQLSAQQKEWTLEECVNYALENNIQVKQTELDVELSEIEKRDALGNFIPSINAQASNAWNTGLTQNVTTGILQNQTVRNFSAGVSAGITVFDGLRNFKQLQRARISRLSSEYSLDKMKDDIALFVADSYLQVLFNKQNLEVLRAQNQITQEQLGRTQDLVDAGVLPQGDLLEIQATMADEKQRMIIAQNQIQISLISLAQTLGIQDYQNFDIVERDYNILGNEILDNTVYEVIERAKEERSEIIIAETNKELAEMDVELAKGAYLPTLGAFFNYNTRETGQGRITGAVLDPDEPSRQIGVVQGTEEIVVAPNTIPTLGSPLPFIDQLYRNDGISYGFQLSVPILNGFATRNQVRRNQINVKRAEYQLEQAELDLEANVYQAYTDANGAFEAYEAAVVAANAQEKAFEYATDRYDVGLTNAFDFSQAKIRYENTQREALRAKYDYIFKLKVVELYFGIPVRDLKF